MRDLLTEGTLGVEGLLQDLLTEGTLGVQGLRGPPDGRDHRIVEDERARNCSLMGPTKPLRTSEVEMHPEGSIQPWLVSAVDGSLSETINIEHPQGARTMPKPELQMEYRGPAKIAAAALKIFDKDKTSAQKSKPSQYLPGVLQRACRSFERFHRLEFGSATEERVDASSLTVAGWAEANVDSFEDIEERKSKREANSLMGGCTSAVPQRGLFPLVEMEKPGLSSVSPAELVLTDVIADSGA